MIVIKNKMNEMIVFSHYREILPSCRWQYGVLCYWRFMPAVPVDIHRHRIGQWIVGCTIYIEYKNIETLFSFLLSKIIGWKFTLVKHWNQLSILNVIVLFPEIYMLIGQFCPPQYGRTVDPLQEHAKALNAPSMYVYGCSHTPICAFSCFWNPVKL